MSTEDESWKEKFSEGTEGKAREGYRPSNGDNNTDEKKMGANGRVLRPRIARPAYSSNASRDTQTRSYQPGATREGGYQPRQQGEGGYQQRPRFQREGGYQPGQASEGGYQQRARFQREGGYQPRQQGESGYQPRARQPREGGYQPRQQGGYQQNRFNGGGNRRQR